MIRTTELLYLCTYAVAISAGCFLLLPWGGMRPAGKWCLRGGLALLAGWGLFRYGHTALVRLGIAHGGRCGAFLAAVLGAAAVHAVWTALVYRLRYRKRPTWVEGCGVAFPLLLGANLLPRLPGVFR